MHPTGHHWSFLQAKGLGEGEAMGINLSNLELKDHGIRGGGPAADNLPADGKTEDQRGNKTHQDIRACLLKL